MYMRVHEVSLVGANGLRIHSGSRGFTRARLRVIGLIRFCVGSLGRPGRRRVSRSLNPE